MFQRYYLFKNKNPAFGKKADSFLKILWQTITEKSI